MQHGASMLRGLGADVTPGSDGSCPSGYFRSCLVQAPGKPASCTCLLSKPPPSAIAVAATGVSHHWGLIAAGVVSAIVIYKFVL